MPAKVSMPDLDFEYKLWKNRLNHFIRETKIYMSRLQAVKTDMPALIDVLLREFDQIEAAAHALYKEIEIHEDEMAYYKKDYPIGRDHQHYADHERIRDKFNKLDGQYRSLVDRMNSEVKALYAV